MITKLKSKLWLLAIPVLVTGLFAFNKTLTVSEESLMKAMLNSLKSQHYTNIAVDDAFSEKLFDLYLSRIDANKKFLLQPDIEELSKYRKELDEQINYATYEYYNRCNELIKLRTAEAEQLAMSILDNPFEFTQDESIQLDNKKAKWAANTAELKEQWRLALKYQVMTRISDMMDEKEMALEKKDTSFKNKSLAEMEVDARAKVKKNTRDYFDRLKKIEDKDRLSYYLNSITAIFDPHTNYFAPARKEDFDAQMSGQFEGIGAKLQEKDGQIKVTEIIPGSASWRQGELKADDIIIKVAQGSADPVDCTDMTLDAVVRMIRGKKGTEVRLTVKKIDGTVKVISIIRDVVEIEETFAKSLILTNKKGNVGYIYLPQFYANFNEKGNGRHCSEDIKTEVQKLKAEGAKGIIMDLRNNGGGSLQDVIDIVGLFIDKGPVVQVKSREGEPIYLNDNDSKVLFDGGLIVMVNEYSASASEIMAAAIQDYQRGVIMGSSSTFGKGTVQRMYDLDNFAGNYRSNQPLGTLKITTQKFYRINGGTTQLKGVIPDIILPDEYQYLDYGEKDEEYPLVWDEIPAARYNTWKNAPAFEKLRNNSVKRIASDPAFTLIEKSATNLKSERDNQIMTLNLEKFRKKVKANKEEGKKLDEVVKEFPSLTFSTLKVDMEQMMGDSTKIRKNKEWISDLKKDIYLNEAFNVMKEML